jgi:HlyD family secretion protein
MSTTTAPSSPPTSTTSSPRRAATRPQIEFTQPAASRWWLWGLVLLGIVSLGTILLTRPGVVTALLSSNEKNAPKSETSELKVDLDNVGRVSCLGRIEPRSRVIKLSAPTSPEGNRVQRLLVDESDRVKQGQLLAILDTFERREAVVSEKEGSVKVAEAKLAQVKAGAKPGDIAAQHAMVIRAESGVKQAEDEYERVETLRQKNNKLISASDVDRRRMERDTAQQTLEHAKAQLAAVKEVRDVDVRLAEAEIAEAKAELAKANADLASAQLIAPIDGTILKVHARSGERVGDRGVVEMGEVDHMYVVAEVYEADVQSIAEGQTAHIQLPSWKEEISGVVDQIGSQIGRKITLDNDPVADTDARVIEVRIRLGDSDSAKVRRMTNMRVEVTIETGHANREGR